MTARDLSTGSIADGAEQKANTAYASPEVFEIGPATELLQGPMVSAPYRDLHNDWYTNWPQP